MLFLERKGQKGKLSEAVYDLKKYVVQLEVIGCVFEITNYCLIIPLYFFYHLSFN